MAHGITEVIARYVKEADATDSHSKIAEKIISDGNSDLSKRSLRRLISEYRSDHGEPVQVETDGEDQPKWYVENETYNIMRGKGYVKFPVSLIDKIFLDYSAHGKNLTSQEILQKYDLKPEQWHLIKGALRLFKASDIFSPWTVENTPAEDLEALLEEKMSRLFRSKDITLKKYRQSLEKEYKKAIHEANSKELETQSFIVEFLEQVDKLDPITIQTFKDLPDDPKRGLLVLADLHVGAETSADLSRTPKFNEEILRERMRTIAEEVNARGYDEVTVVCLGDLIESFTGLNHKNSWKGVEKGKWGANVVISAYNIIAELIGNLKGFQKLYLVSGNHDRSTSSNDEDTTGEISRIISYFLSKTIGEESVMDLGDIGSFRFGYNLNIIPTHGHLYLARQNAAAMCWKYGRQGLFNLILMGHYHSRMIKNGDDGIDFRKVVVSSVFSGNRYSDQAGFDGSTGGYMIIEEKPNGQPRMIDETL